MASVAGERAVVVGGGVVGAACAYYLSLTGRPVTVIDKGAFGRACSHGNCGYVSPSHILPVCQPGVVGSTLRSMFRKNSPFYLKPRFDPALWSWMYQFARRCNQKDMLQTGHALHALLFSSRDLWGEVVKLPEFADCEWEDKGLLFVFLDHEHFDHYAEVNSLLTKEYGVSADPIDLSALQKLEPALKPHVAGAWHYRCDAHLRSDRVMQSWKQLLLKQGIEIREQCEFKSFLQDNGGVRGIETSSGPIEAGQVIVAAGAWTPLLQNQLKCRVPVQPGKGYSITMARPERCPKYPMIFEQHRVAVTPFHSGYRLGSTMEFAGYDATLNRTRLKILTEGAKHYLHTPTAEPLQEEWFGWRPMSCDGRPIIGRVPAFKNVWLATGHSMLGLSMATGTGRLLTEMISGNKPHIDPRPYAVDRF